MATDRPVEQTGTGAAAAEWGAINKLQEIGNPIPPRTTARLSAIEELRVNPSNDDALGRLISAFDQRVEEVAGEYATRQGAETITDEHRQPFKDTIQDELLDWRKEMVDNPDLRKLDASQISQQLSQRIYRGLRETTESLNAPPAELTIGDLAGWDVHNQSLVPGSNESPQEIDLKREQQKAAVTEAMNSLPPRYQQALRGRFYENKTFDEIGKDMDVTSTRAQQLVSKGLRQLGYKMRLQERGVEIKPWQEPEPKPAIEPQAKPIGEQVKPTIGEQAETYVRDGKEAAQNGKLEQFFKDKGMTVAAGLYVDRYQKLWPETQRIFWDQLKSNFLSRNTLARSPLEVNRAMQYAEGVQSTTTLTQVAGENTARPGREVVTARNLGTSEIQTRPDGTRTIIDPQVAEAKPVWLTGEEVKGLLDSKKALEDRVSRGETLQSEDAQRLEKLRYFEANMDKPELHRSMIENAGAARPPGGFRVTQAGSGLLGIAILFGTVLQTQAGSATSFGSVPRAQFR